MKNRNLYIIPITIFLIFYLTGSSFYVSLVFPISFFFLNLFVVRLPKTIAFKELTILIFCIQLLVSSYFAFYIEKPDATFMPEGDPEDYFRFAILAVIAFGSGLFAYNKHSIIESSIFDKFKQFDLFEMGKLLVITGYVFNISQILSLSFGYFGALLTSLANIGGIMILFSNNPKLQKIIWFFAGQLFVIFNGLYDGIFFMMLVWGAFTFLFYSFYNRPSLKRRILILAIGLYSLFIIQQIKTEYRKFTAVNATFTIGHLFTFGEIFINGSTKVDSKAGSNTVTRANQGAIVTWIMNYIPNNQPFVEGETIKDAVLASIFPRFMMPNKAESGGRKNFVRFTGRRLIGDTSINISILGEAYANFGVTGGIIFMFFVGLLYNLIFYLFIRFSFKYPFYFFFMPLVFLYAIKSEDDFVTPINQIVKTFYVMMLFHITLYKTFITTHTIRPLKTKGNSSINV